MKRHQPKVDGISLRHNQNTEMAVLERRRLIFGERTGDISISRCKDLFNSIAVDLGRKDAFRSARRETMRLELVDKSKSVVLQIFFRARAALDVGVPYACVADLYADQKAKIAHYGGLVRRRRRYLSWVKDDRKCLSQQGHRVALICWRAHRCKPGNEFKTAFRNHLPVSPDLHPVAQPRRRYVKHKVGAH